MIINHNIAALNTHRQLSINTANTNKNIEKLSSGLRINRAGDDAAGLAISEKMRGQIRGLDQASRNAQDGISLIQTAEGALNETHSILQRMRELATQSANGTNTDTDRGALQDEMNQLTSEINRIGNTTEFNTQKLLNGGIGSADGSKVTKAASADVTLANNFAKGTVAADTAATKALTANATTATTTAAAAATTTTMTTAAGTVADGTKIVIDGKYTFDIGGTALAGTAADSTTLGDLLASDGVTKLSDVADLTAGTATLTIASKTEGPFSSVDVDADTASVLNNNAANNDTGEGVGVTANGKSFDLSGLAIDVTDADAKEATLAALKALTATDGSGTKLSDIMDVKFNGSKLEFTTKEAGGVNSVQFTANADDAALGLTAASDAGTANKASGTNGTRIVVDNVSFNLGGIKIDATDATTKAASIEALKNVTSGGVKLGDLVDIKDNNGKLEFTAKSSGTTSTIAFTGDAADAALGLTTANLGTANGVKGSATTIERAGLQATSSLSTATGGSAAKSIAANSSFKITVGTDSAVDINLGPDAKTYDTDNVDANVANAARADLVKDLNAALQKAGLDGKVTASVSADNKIQFISEGGKDIKLADGAGSPLAAVGFTGSATTPGDLETVKNVNQVVGPGAQGSGFTTKFQIGANTGQSMSLDISDMRSAALGITGNAGQTGFTKTNSVTNGTNDIKSEAALDISTKEGAAASIAVLDKAINSVSSERSKLGAVQNRLEHTINNLGTSSENLTAAESRIRDVDMAKEMMEQTKNNILAQAAQAMLAQANQQPQGVLQLLR